MLSWFLAANPVESAVHRFLWEAVRCEAHVRMDGLEAWGRGHRQSEEAPLNSCGWRSHSWAGTIVDTLETIECVTGIYPERRIKWKTIDDDYTYNHSALTWYGTVFKHPKRRHNWPHRPVVKGKESVVVRSRKLDDTTDRTFRNRVTIGSSFKSSFSWAATSMEYTRKTFLTSAVCTEIYWKRPQYVNSMWISMGTAQRPGGNHVSWRFSPWLSSWLCNSDQSKPANWNIKQICWVCESWNNHGWRTTRINFWRVDSLSLA